MTAPTETLRWSFDWDTHNNTRVVATSHIPGISGVMILGLLDSYNILVVVGHSLNIDFSSVSVEEARDEFLKVQRTLQGQLDRFTTTVPEGRTLYKLAYYLRLEAITGVEIPDQLEGTLKTENGEFELRVFPIPFQRTGKEPLDLWKIEVRPTSSSAPGPQLRIRIQLIEIETPA